MHESLDQVFSYVDNNKTLDLIEQRDTLGELMHFLLQRCLGQVFSSLTALEFFFDNFL